jgi:Flp pilus assembly pilin Flp
MSKLLKKFLEDEEAPTAVEYVFMVAGIALVILAAVWFFGGAVSNKFDDAGKQLNAPH